MKYFIDTEFIEGNQKKFFGETKPTIDLISIGIVAEDGREYYAISKDFNLKESWNRCQIGKDGLSKEYWIRDNVLLPIYIDKVHGDMRNHFPFSYLTMKGILKGFGKSNKQIAKEIIRFIDERKEDNNVEFYGYFSDYDWVVFCWLFGGMIALPRGFPMYCIDLKQTLDEIERFISKSLKEYPEYPKQINGHNSLSDAKWNYKLYKFLETFK